MPFDPAFPVTPLADRHWSWPLSWASHAARHRDAARRRLRQALQTAPVGCPTAALDCAEAIRQWQAAAATAAFDAARDVHAAQEVAGPERPSLLASARFERALGWSEVVALGPWARRV